MDDTWVNVVDDYVSKKHEAELLCTLKELNRQIGILRREVADLRSMMELSDIRKRDEYIRRGVVFPFTPEQSKFRPGTFRLRSIL